MHFKQREIPAHGRRKEKIKKTRYALWEWRQTADNKTICTPFLHQLCCWWFFFICPLPSVFPLCCVVLRRKANLNLDCDEDTEWISLNYGAKLLLRQALREQHDANSNVHIQLFDAGRFRNTVTFFTIKPECWNAWSFPRAMLYTYLWKSRRKVENYFVACISRNLDHKSPSNFQSIQQTNEIYHTIFLAQITLPRCGTTLSCTTVDFHELAFVAKVGFVLGKCLEKYVNEFG